MRTLLLLVAAAACAQPSGPSVLTAADSAALRQLDADFVGAILRRDWAGLAGVYADSAVLLPPNGGPVSGATAISQWFANSGFQITEFTTTIAAIEGQGDLGVVRSSYHLGFTIPPGNQVISDSGKAVWVVRRAPDGRWRIGTDIWNTSLPRPGAGAP